MKIRPLGLVVGCALIVCGTPSFADEAAVGGGAGGSISTSGAAVAQTAAPDTGAPRATAVAVVANDDDTSDHNRFVGHLGVGYFGVSQIPIARDNTGARDDLNAPVIGVRYWFKRNMAIDAGVGLGWTMGGNDREAAGTTTSADKPSRFGLGFHAGLPIALAYGKHYTFEIIPEATVAFATGSIKGAGSDQSISGFRFDVGARVGPEIHFGFIGVPELALQASVGLYFHRDATKWSQDNNSVSDGNTTLATSVQSDPWALFVNNISALYYF